ncbi:MAG: hypothetical protein EAZ19_01950 [Oscillatoriales cyanobacterium]|nr:MAG: hypothetical protein EAZ88_07635 [Oscillatoriales cyanobacterium]TAF91091.1 MAG: hypothetical protein EAZ49_06815 [Oscillatoriales cyanobacterium]TAG15880.1 MAG: hypothetical protein EAZ39_19115 [Oscillatoriales cyanobacterium]TAG44140.1 MAG: hypothetical protein EAZ33_10905 [Oscillatoriales cyanobacterium]TAG58232.1 MAG: hypothetical protein EAZ28_15520 [Oscillatoriales cyanobacterium]
MRSIREHLIFEKSIFYYSAVPAQKRIVVRTSVRSLKNASCKTEMLPTKVFFPNPCFYQKSKAEANPLP